MFTIVPMLFQKPIALKKCLLCSWFNVESNLTLKSDATSFLHFGPSPTGKENASTLCYN